MDPTKKEAAADAAKPGAQAGASLTEVQRKILRVLEQWDRAKRKERSAAVKQALEYARKRPPAEKVPTPDDATRLKHLPAIPASFPVTASDTAREFLVKLQKEHPKRSLRLMERNSTGGDVMLEGTGAEASHVGDFRYEERKTDENAPHEIRFEMNKKSTALDVVVFRPPSVAGLRRASDSDQGAILHRLRMAREAVAAKLGDVPALIYSQPRPKASDRGTKL